MAKNSARHHLSVFRIIEISVLVVLLLAIPFTIFLSKQKQTLQQHADEITYLQRTIDFNDLPAKDKPLNHEYPAGIIDWGKNVWELTPPWVSWTSNSIEFADRQVRSARFRLVTPARILKLTAYNGGGSSASHVVLNCDTESPVSIRVLPEKSEDMNTGWQNLCHTVTIAISNGWNTSIDDIVVAIPTLSGVPTGTINPSVTTSLKPTSPGNPPTRTPTLVLPTVVPTITQIPPVSGGGIWHPALNTSWQWQLSTPVDTSLNVQMYDIDGFDNAASVVSALHAQGKKVVCYIDVGSWENFRSDQAEFPASVEGDTNGWPGEKWLDIRQLSTLAPIMTARLDMCKQKGFDAVEPDNVDGYTNKTGFPLTAQDQLTYNEWIANQVHARGMSVALKNDVDQASQLAPYFDWALNEQCFQYNECGGYTNSFINAGKAVFEVEYKLTTSQFCSQANALNFNSLKKDLNLTVTRTACR